MALQNEWVRYFDRSAQQIKDRVLTQLGFLVPEITDHTEGNPYIRGLSIWSGIAEMIGYYVDNSAREAHLSSARLYWSGVKIAYSYDYRIRSRLASTGSATLTLTGTTLIAPLIIPIDTELTDSRGYKWRTTSQITLNIGYTAASLPIKQIVHIPVQNLGTSKGAENETFVLPSNVADYSAVVVIGADTWSTKDTLAYSVFDSKDIRQTVNESKVPIVLFGDGFSGKTPVAGDVITATYDITEGEAGNSGANQPMDLELSGINVPIGTTLTITATSELTNGSEIESLDQLQTHIPQSIRTLYRAITDADFKDIAEMSAGVENAYVDFTCGKTVPIYIVPDGGGEASSGLISSTFAWFEDKRAITTKVDIKAAGQVRIKAKVVLRVRSEFQQVIVSNAVKEAWATFLSYQNQEIGGTVYISDLYAIIESTSGVSSSDITELFLIPYARITNGSSILDWVATPKHEAVSTVVWNIKLITSTTFELYRNNAFQLIGTIGTTLTGLIDLTLTVNPSSYVVGDSWEFTTYRFAVANMVLDEPSIPISDTTDITIETIGGI